MCFEDVAVTLLPIWFVVLWLGALVLSIFSRSLLLCLGLIVLSVLAGIGITETSELNEIVKYGLMAVFYGVAGFGVYQIIYKVRGL